MPLPKPRADEDQDAFISRCMSSFPDDGTPNDQKVAICFSQWKQKESQMATTIERRAFPIEFRLEQGEAPKIRGYAAVFNQESELLGGFRETIAPGAFKKTLKEADVRALFNHDPNFVLGRTSAGTLALREDKNGLYMEIDAPDTQQGRDVMTLIERGDVDQASFAFRVVKDTWTNEEGQTPTRTLDEVQLFDVSPVTYPAYTQTSVAVRSMTTNSDEIRHILDALVSEPGDHSEEPVTAEEFNTQVRDRFDALLTGLRGDDHSNEPEEAHSEPIKVRPRSLLSKEWRLAMEAAE